MKITVIGNGAWGSAITLLVRRHGHSTMRWGRHPQVDDVQDLKEALHKTEMVLLAIPSHAMREVCHLAKPHLPKDVLLVSLAKGMEEDTDLRMSEVIKEVTKRQEVAVMSGPTFASEVARSAPSAIVCAASNREWSKKIQDAMNGEDFRVYTHRDVVGVELGGALKNIIAIAAGACVGMKLGDNALAALITRGLTELSRIGTALGGESQTFYGLSGVGDLVLTCSSSQSRNRCVGEALGRGESLPKILASLHGTAEGIRTARSVHQILQKKKLEAPILQQVYSVLYESKPTQETVKALMAREPKPEFG